MVEIKTKPEQRVSDADMVAEGSRMLKSLGLPEGREGLHDLLASSDKEIVSAGADLLKQALGPGTHSSAYGRDFGPVRAMQFGSAASEPLDNEPDPAQVVERGLPRPIARFEAELGASNTKVILAGGRVEIASGEISARQMVKANFSI